MFGLCGFQRQLSRPVKVVFSDVRLRVFVDKCADAVSFCGEGSFFRCRSENKTGAGYVGISKSANLIPSPNDEFKM